MLLFIYIPYVLLFEKNIDIIIITSSTGSAGSCWMAAQ